MHRHCAFSLAPRPLAALAATLLALPLAAQAVPRITTIRQDIAAGARAMVDALFARIGGSDAGSVVLDPELVLRETA